MKLFALAFILISLFTLSACVDDSAPAEPNSAALKVLADAQLRDAKRAQDIANAKAAQEVADKKRRDDDAAREIAKAKALNDQAERAAKIKADEEARRIANDKAAAELAEQKRLADIKAQAEADKAKADAEARALQAKVDREKADAEVKRIELEKQRAVDEAQRAKGQTDFYNLVFNLSVLLALLFAFCFGAYAINQLLNVSVLRRSVIETRNGTMILMTLDGQPSAQPLNPPPLRLMPGQDDWLSDADVIDAKSFILHQSGKTSVVSNADPNETDWKLVKRLLRAAMQVAGSDADYIPSADVLCWPDDTRNRAVALLKPHVIARVGKPPKGQEGRGTVLAPNGNYDTLAQLYSDVTNRTIALSPLASAAQAKA